MSLTTVGIAGADDTVPHSALVDLSRRFPFVEWGILISPKQAGQPRYPTMAWCGGLFERPELRLAAHICGQRTRDFLATGVSFLHPMFSRVQVNGWRRPAEPDAFRAMRGELRLILQCRSEDTLQQVANDAAELGNADVLFDPSGGRGIESFRYPPTPSGCHLGFAGGIGPDNVLDVVGEIAMGAGVRPDFWIDMESGVRDEGDRFDLERVEAVLAKCAPLTTPSVPGERGRR